MANPKTCEACSHPFTPTAHHQKACSDTCRQRLHRRRTASEAKAVMAPPLESPPPMPDGFGEGGRKMWSTIWASNRWSADDIPSIIRRCQLQDRWDEASAAIHRDGLIDSDGKVHPAHAVQMKLCTELNSLDDRLALNPRASALQAMKMRALTEAPTEELESKLDTFLREAGS